MRKRGQISTEYLLAYGVALLVILSGTFFFLKYSQSNVQTQQECIFTTPGIECEGFKKVYYDDSTNLNPLYQYCGTPENCLQFKIKNTLHEPITIHSFGIGEYPELSFMFSSDMGISTITPITLEPGESTDEIYLYFEEDGQFNPKSILRSDLILKYNKGDNEFVDSIKGYMSGILMPLPESED